MLGKHLKRSVLLPTSRWINYAGTEIHGKCSILLKYTYLTAYPTATGNVSHKTVTLLLSQEEPPQATLLAHLVRSWVKMPVHRRFTARIL